MSIEVAKAITSLANHCHCTKQSLTTKYYSWRIAFANSSRKRSVCNCCATEIPLSSWQTVRYLCHSDSEVFFLPASKDPLWFQCECPGLLSQQTREREQLQHDRTPRC